MLFVFVLFVFVLFVFVLGRFVFVVDFRVFVGFFCFGLAVFRRGGLFGFLDARADEFAVSFHQFPQFVSQRVVFREDLCDQMPGSLEHFRDGGQTFFGVDEFGSSGGKIGSRRLGGHDFVGQRFQAAVAGLSGQGLLLGLERQIQIFQSPQGIGRLDASDQLVRRSALRFQRLENPLFAVGQRPQPSDRLLDTSNLLLVESTGLILPIARDEGNRIAVVQQLDCNLHSVQGQSDFSRHLPQINLNPVFHSRPTGGC